MTGRRFAVVSAERFAYLKDRLGDGFTTIGLDQADGNPNGLDSPLTSSRHSVLTIALDDEPGTPTRAAVDEVLSFLVDRLAITI